ncbi:hypothetical protein [Zhihengliuella halotolerans]|uniref:hypothetical protein n=1 Tax=Zhihengliuella halotolerans TaxID=370736 RepID=UPI000C802141|nr:hypothetical protein [Zhihengliuella halotolerans]
MYLDVDYLTPMLQVSVAILCVLAALPLCLHALARWIRFRREAEGRRTYALRSSIRIEAVVGGALVAATVVFAGFGLAGLTTAGENLQRNIHRAYPDVETIESYAWNGSAAVVDVVMTTGERHVSRQVTILADGRPLLDLPQDDAED